MSNHVKVSNAPFIPAAYADCGCYPYTQEEVLELAAQYHADGARLCCDFNQDKTMIPVADALVAKGHLRFIRIRHVKIGRQWFQIERIYAITPAGKLANANN